ncbi:MAG TPA: phosphoribosylformylglycinamidine cyclo-ligase [Candidatus Thermoplasmatota archaeon]|nr:phosphoribosylformylglycinamidine cyclo-ligase [Candidatus Thermoplasmatota archaeon]
MTDEPLTYAKSGVDIQAKDQAAKAIHGLLSYARSGVGRPLGGAGHFAGLVEFGEHALVLATDGVGTKLEVATALRKWDTVGIDCVAMNVNDAVCVGAEPIAFVDYLAIDKPDPALVAELAKGLNEGARQSNMTIVGGETAVLPSIVNGFDLAGTVLGFVRKDEIVGGQAIAPGDVMLGVPSSGVHSNGYTLVRKAMERAGVHLADPLPDGRTVGETLLEPTRIYVRAVLDMLGAVPRSAVHGISHITGSGLLNVPRLRKDVRYVLDDPLDVPPIFRHVQRWGGVEEAEMWRTFNMGMGLCVLVAPGHAEAALAALRKHWSGAKRVGRVEPGTGVSVPRFGVELTGAKASF